MNGSRVGQYNSLFLKTVLLVLIFSLLATVYAMTTTYAAARQISVESVIGDVFMKKGGGSHEIQVYQGMTLVEGDSIRTGPFSTAVLKVEDRDDLITISANSEMYLSKLALDGDAKQTQLNMWTGSLYVKVDPMSNRLDELEVLSPNTKMNAKGTHFTTGIDPVTGDTWLSVFSGIVGGSHRKDSSEGSMDGDNDDHGFDIYPSQNGYFFDDESGDDLPPIIAQIDLDELINRVDSDVISMLLQNREDINNENEDFIEQIREGLRDQGFLLVDGDTGQVTEEDRLRLNQNLDNLINNIIKNAVENNRVSKDELAAILAAMNRAPQLDLDGVPPLEDLRGERANQAREELERAREQRQRQQEEQRRQAEERENRNKELLERLEKQRQEQAEANRAAADEARRAAEEQYLQRLNESERQRFEESLRAREEERKRANEERQNREEREENRQPPARPTPPTGGSGGSGGGGGSSNQPLTPPQLTAEHAVIGEDIHIDFEDSGNWFNRLDEIQIDGNSIGKNFEVASGQVMLASELFTEAGTYTITFKARGYRDATMELTIREISVVTYLGNSPTNDDDLKVKSSHGGDVYLVPANTTEDELKELLDNPDVFVEKDVEAGEEVKFGLGEGGLENGEYVFYAVHNGIISKPSQVFTFMEEADELETISGYIDLPEGVDIDGKLFVTVTAIDQENLKPISYTTVEFQNSSEEKKLFEIKLPNNRDGITFLRYDLVKNNVFHHLVSSAYFYRGNYAESMMTTLAPPDESWDPYAVSTDQELQLAILPAMEMLNVKNMYRDSLIVDFKVNDFNRKYDFIIVDEDNGERWSSYEASGIGESEWMEGLLFDGEVATVRIPTTYFELKENTNYTLILNEYEFECNYEYDSECFEGTQLAIGSHSFQTPNNLKGSSESITGRLGEAPEDGKTEIVYGNAITLKNRDGVRILKYEENEIKEILIEASSIDVNDDTLVIEHELFTENAAYVIYLDEGVVASQEDSSIVNHVESFFFNIIEPE